MLFKRQWKHIDKVLVAAAVLIVAISICIIGSATHINKGAINYDFVAKQGGAFIVNLLLVLFVCNYDYTKLRRIAKPLYVINLLMLVAVMFLGRSALGAQRWIQIGPLTLQPSEFSKLIMIVCMAALLADQYVERDYSLRVMCGHSVSSCIKTTGLGNQSCVLGNCRSYAFCQSHKVETSA